MFKEILPHVYTLPLVRLTRVQFNSCSDGLPVSDEHQGRKINYVREVILPTATRFTQFRSIPLVINGSGRPWAEACLWILERSQLKPFSIDSLKPIAQDLAAYKKFLDELEIEWDDFSSVEKYTRPTYLYRSHLQGKINDGELKKSTASRRMSSIISFYRFLMRNSRMRFSPKNDPWIDRDIGIAYVDGKGFKQLVNVTTTDVSIKVPKNHEALDEIIADGGRLQPLPFHEQKALITALKELGNVEFMLMHYMALLTGAREMTVLTFRMRDVICPVEQILHWPHKIRCGPGTGIDTKNNVADVYISMPRILYEELHAYVTSGRAMKRRSKTARGEDLSNYLFLTQHGQPYYESKEDRNNLINVNSKLRRSALSGRPLRKFIQQRVVATVRKTHPNFTYRFHDLRASFGMNWVDFQMQQAGSEDLGEHYLWAREQLRKLMWHKSPITTDRYLDYRKNIQKLNLAQIEWSEHLQDLIKGSI